MKLNRISKSGQLTFYTPEATKGPEIPLFSSPTSAGFPSPADDYIETRLDISKMLIKNPDATYYVRVEGESMKDAGINNGALLVVDRSLDPKNNSIAICSINGEFTVKRITIRKNELYLKPENDQFKPIKVTEFDNFMVWGVVTFIIQKPL